MTETEMQGGDENTSDTGISDMTLLGSGAAMFGVGMVFQALFGFFTNFLLANGLGAAGYGTYSYGKTLISISRTFSKFGSNESLLRFLPQYSDSPDRQNRIIGLSVLTSLTAGAALAGLLYLSAPAINQFTLENEWFTLVLRMLALSLPFSTMVIIIANVFRGTEHAKYQIGIQKIIRPLFRLVAVGFALLLGYAVFGTVAALVIASVLVFLVSIALFYTKTDFTPTVSSNFREAHEYYNFALPLALTSAGSVLYSQVDVLMVGYFLSDIDVGIYSISILISTFMGMPLTGLNQLFPPVASRLHNKSKYEDLNNVFATTTRWAFSFSLLFAVAAFLYRSEILELFGGEFIAGTVVLSLFLLSQLIRNAVGPCGYLLMMTDHQYLVMINRLALGIFNVVANYILILEFGLIGAALGSAAVLSVVNVARLVEIYYLEGYFPYTVEYYKPMLAVAAAALIMWGVSLVLDGIVLIVTGGICAGMVFLWVLYALGIQQEERELLQSIKSNMTARISDTF